MSLYDRDYMRLPSSRLPAWLAGWTPLHWIIGANILVFCLQHLGFGFWGTEFANPATGETVIQVHGGVSVQALAEGRVWTAFTYMFVHDSVLHLVGNMLMVAFVGSRVQALLGPRSFLMIYFLAGLVGAGLQMAVYAFAKGELGVPMVGASACGFGLLLALASMLPEERITTLLYFIIPISSRLWTLAMVFMGLELFLGVSALVWDAADSMWGQIASFAHLGGAFLGWYYVRLLGYGGHPMTYERLWRERQPARRAQRHAVARVRRAQATPEIVLEAARKRQQEPGRSGLATMEDVDSILDKISTHGISSLSEEEKRLLDEASREISRRDRRP
jgi:membrane associated rhomboid family serine protease